MFYNKKGFMYKVPKLKKTPKPCDVRRTKSQYVKKKGIMLQKSGNIFRKKMQRYANQVNLS